MNCKWLIVNSITETLFSVQKNVSFDIENTVKIALKLILQLVNDFVQYC